MDTQYTDVQKDILMLYNILNKKWLNLPLFGIAALLLMRGVVSDLEGAGLSCAIGVESAIDAVLQLFSSIRLNPVSADFFKAYCLPDSY